MFRRKPDFGVTGVEDGFAAVLAPAETTFSENWPSAVTGNRKILP
jgi:hypothetical protein